jgi:glycine/D-amino acid oxidase-like deaminating enzyme
LAHDSETWQAAVIGGGLFGCRLALELRRHGFDRVLLIEREALDFTFLSQPRPVVEPSGRSRSSGSASSSLHPSAPF